MPNFENMALRLTATSLWSSVTYACDIDECEGMCSCARPNLAWSLPPAKGWDVLTANKQEENDKLAVKANKLAVAQLDCYESYDIATKNCSTETRALRSSQIATLAARWAYNGYSSPQVMTAARTSVRVGQGMTIVEQSNPTANQTPAEVFAANIAKWWKAAFKYLSKQQQGGTESIGKIVFSLPETAVFKPADKDVFIALFEIVAEPPTKFTTAEDFKTFISLMDAMSDWVYGLLVPIVSEEDGDGDPDTLYGHSTKFLATQLSPIHFAERLSLSRMTIDFT